MKSKLGQLAKSFRSVSRQLRRLGVYRIAGFRERSLGAIPIAVSGKEALWLVGTVRGSCRYIRLVILGPLGSGQRKLSAGCGIENKNTIAVTGEISVAIP
jgi:hypothetical protein